MAISNNGTKIADLVNPEVLADFIDSKLVDAIRFAPLATIDYTLQGRPGNTVTLPSYAYIGDATVVAEGADIPIKKLSASETTVTVHKIGNGAEFSDEALYSGFGNPAEEAANQLVTSIASGVEVELLSVLAAVSDERTVTVAGTVPTSDELGDSLVKFGEDIEGEKVVLVSPEGYKELRKGDWLPASNIAAEILVKGAVGEAHGCQVVVSNRLSATNDMFVVKPGALRIFTKRETLVETDRDIVSKTTVITADKHFASYLYDESKVIRLKVGE